MNKKIPYQVQNWPEYNKALCHRGSLTVWISEEIVQAWRAQPQGLQGAQRLYSDEAIILGLTLHGIYRLPLRQTTGLLASAFQQMDLSLPVPHYSTLCRRRQSLPYEIPVRFKGDVRDIAVDSTGVKVFGAGEWLARQHGPQGRRGWLKLHVAIDVETQEIVAPVVSDHCTHDGPVLSELLEQIEEPIDRVFADGAYDSGNCHAAVEAQGGQLVAPPREDAIERVDIPQRTQYVKEIAETGRQAWKKGRGYHRRSLVETAMSRLKRILGGELKSRLFDAQATDLFIHCQILNRMFELGRPQSLPMGSHV